MATTNEDNTGQPQIDKQNWWDKINNNKEIIKKITYGLSTFAIVLHFILFITGSVSVKETYSNSMDWKGYFALLSLTLLITLSIFFERRIIISFFGKHVSATILLIICIAMITELSYTVINNPRSDYVKTLVQSYANLYPYLLLGILFSSIFFFFFPRVSYMKTHHEIDNVINDNTKKKDLDAVSKEHLIYSRKRFTGQIENLMINARNAQIAAYIALVIGISVVIYLVVEDLNSAKDIKLEKKDSKLIIFIIQMTYYKLLIVVITIFISNKFFQQYRKNLIDIRYLQNELTNIESKIIYLSIIGKSESSVKILEELNKIERNFILQDGQHTINSKEIEINNEKTEHSILNIVKLIKDLFQTK